ncbi:Polyketide cyclase / dehydrase and lipid transport [Lentzea albidocapillata subsp. violacea]|uniref:Polyketide cyclase / dehydrase and lipid transport n=1 Tax=Lentzea albidocapillata subsp. violacea TaxID=128104 RepID=A0A1G9T1K8_9PSEU|nr:Polyketide cyclase / dehydrase and lipid transport [Lentzea albidocapillata subsp. violacea]
MMVAVSLNRYRFRSVWHVDASPADVYEVLSDIANYPLWWREVRRATKIDDETGELRCRSFLPFDLVVQVRHSIRNQQAGLLRATLSGDLEGYASWEIIGRDGGTDLLFDQEVVVNKALLRRLVLIAKPFFRGNHDVMMRGGFKGLKAALEEKAASRES